MVSAADPALNWGVSPDVTGTGVSSGPNSTMLSAVGSSWKA